MQGQLLYPGESRLQEIRAGSPGYRECVSTAWFGMCEDDVCVLLRGSVRGDARRREGRQEISRSCG